MVFASGCAAQPYPHATQSFEPTLTPFQPAPTTAPAVKLPPSTPSTDQVTPTEEIAMMITSTQPPEKHTDEPASTTPAKQSTEVHEPGMITVPILLYHHVSDTIDTQYNVHPDRFAEQMKWLFDRGYSTISVADLARVIRDGGALPARPVILTFDDGYRDVYENAYPILQRYGFFATFYIIGETVNTRGNLSTNELLELIAGGWEIGSHSMSHTNLKEDNNWDYEIYNSKVFLEEKLGIEILTFAYPYGAANTAIMDYTYDSGYSAAVGLGSIMDHDNYDLYFLHRKEVKSWYELDFFEEFMPWKD